MSTNRRVRLSAAVVAAALLSVPTASVASAAPAPEAPQWRSLWVDAFNPGLRSPEEVAEVVRHARASGVGVLLVQAAPRMDCLCNSSTLPRRATGMPAPYDPLAEVVAQGHAAGLEVHAWVNVTSIWNGSTPPPDPAHVLNRHGLSATGTDRWLDRRVDGGEIADARTHLDLGNPKAVAYVVDAVASIQRNYDVDGINLDHVRYPDYNRTGYVNDWGYSSTSLARFRAATGRTDTPHPSDVQFTKWRRDQVTSLVRKLYVRMAAQDPTDRLSVNGTAYDSPPQQWTDSRPYNGVLQDYRGWMGEGIVDTVTAMNYRNGEARDQAASYAAWTATLARMQAETGRHAVSGAGLYLNTIDRSVEQARVATSAGIGWSGYSFTEPSIVSAKRTSERPAEREALARRLSTEVFTRPAAVPAMPWRTKPTNGMLQGTVVYGRTPRDQVTLTIRRSGSTATRTVRSDGSGWFGAVGLRPGTYVVQVTGRGVTSAPKQVTVRAGAVASTTVGLTRR